MAAFFIPMNSFLVSKFEQQTLSNLVTHCFGSDFSEIYQKRQIAYVRDYLDELGAKSVLLELNYVDKDYLEDFSRYYVKRFGNAGHKCARMHFFSSDVTHQHIEKVLKGEADSEQLARDLNDSYLGFMVIKPLPKTFIGKTCLKVMSDVPAIANAAAGADGTIASVQVGDTGQIGRQKCRLSRTYVVDLFGIELSVRSIAFQEQDKVVAACASTAIWSALHTLKWCDVRTIHSCSEITMNAINHIDGSSNSFPNKELTNKQILRSLDVEGLRHHSEDLKKQQLSEEDFLATVIGHIDSHLPLVLTGSVHKVVDEGLDPYDANHAICILGYKVDSESVVYVHDDRLGPYARALLVKLSDFKPGAAANAWALGLQLMDETTKIWLRPHELIVPEFLAAATDKKARLPFFYAHYTGRNIALAFEDISTAVGSEPFLEENGLTYAVKLRSISDIRQGIRSQVADACHTDLLTGEIIPIDQQERDQWDKDKAHFLMSSFARLQWEVQFFCRSQKAFRIFIDASDIPQGNAVSAIFVDSIYLSKPALNVLKRYGSFKEERAQSAHFYDSFLARLRDQDETLDSYLETTYGALRAPIKLKKQEFAGGEIFDNETRKVLRDSTHGRIGELLGRFDEPGLIYLIWAIAEDGALLVGEEVYVRIDGNDEPCGHPSITRFKPARIAGELWKVEGGWVINSMSGRYSGDYHNSSQLLKNALMRFRAYFPKDEFAIEAFPAKSRFLTEQARLQGVKVNAPQVTED
ncbi:hypothetical protein [Pseudomonas sp. NFR16]|uniref:hypothetical protein n=1 Tax=Pseudomonas sp. NFR16 TaxID=1566248 RepID=UPI0008B9F5BC|nr:hypothetical protein [Pseudomonas sp. NFR16]SEJ77333.1 hypothetical protein SAMN03159495_4459 [Pseudomonas sp. NFR16]